MFEYVGGSMKNGGESESRSKKLMPTVRGWREISIAPLPLKGFLTEDNIF
jgi:hypothetical protein